MQRFMRIGTILCLATFVLVFVAGPPAPSMCEPGVSGTNWPNVLFVGGQLLAITCLIAPLLSWSVYEYRFDGMARAFMLLPIVVLFAYATAVLVFQSDWLENFACMLADD